MAAQRSLGAAHESSHPAKFWAFNGTYFAQFKFL